MPIGDTNDLYNLLKANLPPWFGYIQDDPVLSAILKGCATTDSYIYDLITYANSQTRIKTATGIFLDYVSQDYFGSQLPRHANENDASFRNRILANLITERATRQGISNILKNLTGTAPIMVEGFSPANIGAYDATFYYDISGGYGGMAPYTGAIYVFMPVPTGFSNIFGYDQLFGYDFHSRNAYVDVSKEMITVTVNDVVQAIKGSKVFGTSIYLYLDGIPYPNNPI